MWKLWDENLTERVGTKIQGFNGRSYNEDTTEHYLFKGNLFLQTVWNYYDLDLYNLTEVKQLLRNEGGR